MSREINVRGPVAVTRVKRKTRAYAKIEQKAHVRKGES